MTAHRVAAHVCAFESLLRTIQATRLQGLALINPRLAVQGVGFECLPGHAGLVWGVMLTPWFMNLQLLPLDTGAAATLPAGGRSWSLDIAGHRLDFIGANEPGIGSTAACSLFSPMHDFADQAAAVATASEVLRQLRPSTVERLARRGFLFGRAAGAT